MNPWDAWENLRRQPQVTICGLISGTSADGIDVAVVEFSGSVQTLDHRVVRSGVFPYSSETRELLRGIPHLSAAEVSAANRLVAGDFAKAAMQLDLDGVDLIASHGQTVFHHSGLAEVRSTLQVGCGDTLAFATGKPVVHNFRAKDVAAGGQGAPLTPATDWILYRKHLCEGTALLNLGGIANLTVFGPTLAETIGFDTGPANCVIDRLVRLMTDGKLSYDGDGAIAASGTIDEFLLADLLGADTFADQKPPKSTGFEAYGDGYVAGLLRRFGPVDARLVATLTAFSAECLARGLRHCPGVNRLVAVGGGAHNPLLVDQIQQRTGRQVIQAKALGIPTDAREAVAFAALGYAFSRGEPIDLSGVTGGGDHLLGQLSLP